MILRRQFNKWVKNRLGEAYVKKAIKESYRSRAAYKLLEIN
jgi:23S rRNA U2552 (ribose-2'-O)-methylase RlmE/FtsJ